MADQLLAMYDEILRNDFAAFVHRGFLEVVPNAKFLPNFHIDVLAAAMEEIRHGRSKRLIANLPPRHLKSFIVSVAFPAFLLGHNPSAQIICASYGQDLADKHARDCRALMQTNFYQRIFSTRLSPDKTAASNFETTAGGCRLATSVTGPLTGRGADYIIIDDPLKANEAHSESNRNAVNEWFDGALYTRITNKETGVIVVVMQRLHEDDLAGHLIEKGGWSVLSLPAIATQAEVFDIETPYGPRRFERQEGDVLHPARESRETLAALKRSMGDWAFSAQYQQTPTPRGGLLVKAAWFQRYTETTLPKSFEQVVLSCDTANKVSELADYTAITVWGIKGPRYFLIDVIRRRLNYPDLKRTIKDLAAGYRATSVLIEDRASGTQLIQELKYEGVHTVVGCSPDGDKVMRLHAQTATIENGFVYLPNEAPWLGDFLHEVTSFPNSKHDDQADSLSQFLAWTKIPNSFANWMEYLRGELEEQKITLRGADGSTAMPTVRMRAPDGGIHVETHLKRGVKIEPDGTALFCEEEATFLARQGWKRV